MKPNRVDEADYEIKKRQTLKPSLKTSRRTDTFYITKKTNIQSQAVKIRKALETSHDQVVVHGLGSSLNRALVLAIEVQKFFMGTLQFHMTTSTVKVTDDLFPLSDECEMGQRDRPISAVHITFYTRIS